MSNDNILLSYFVFKEDFWLLVYIYFENLRHVPFVFSRRTKNYRAIKKGTFKLAKTEHLL